MHEGARSSIWNLLLAAGVLACVAPAAAAQVALRNMQLLAHRDDYPPAPAPWGYSACWSYIHPDGREYAVLGTREGTAIYNVTDPANPYRVGFFAGPTSNWREMKSYRTWIYVTTEGYGPDAGVQIIRMIDPDHPVLAATYTGAFTHSHTVQVDTTRALLICNGTTNDAGEETGMRVLSLAAPEAPIELGWWPGGAIPVPGEQYVHDCVVVGNRLFASCVYVGIERVLDLTLPTQPTEIGSWTYPRAYYCHSAWPDMSGRYLYVADEQNGQTLRIFDLTNLAAPSVVNEITPNPAAIVHNPRVRGSELYLANYTEGIRVLDLSDPVHPAEFGWADSFAGQSGGYNGCWEVCPYFPSGTVIASDMNTGLYVYRPLRNYGLIRVKVVDTGGEPLAGIQVFLASPAESLITPADGVVVFAPSPGSRTVTARKFGYFNAAATRAVSVGSRDTVTVTMVPRTVGSYSGQVRNLTTQVPLEDADVDLEYTPLHADTDSLGRFSLATVPSDNYRIEVHRPGFIPIELTRSLGPGNTSQIFSMTPAARWDPLETETGWTVGAPGDDAPNGLWIRVEPLGTGTQPQGAPARARPPDSGLVRRHPGVIPLHEEPSEGAVDPGPVQPEEDRTPAPGETCFVTGQGTDPHNVAEQDVDYGHTTLVSPTLDCTGMTSPTIGYWRWFFTSGDVNDWLAVQISNDDGATWVPVDTLRGLHNEWEEAAIPVGDHVVPSAQVRVRFQAADYGNVTTVEAAIDDLTLYDAALESVEVVPGPDARLSVLGAWPNPAHGEVRLSVLLPRAAPLTVDVLDALGRRLRRLHQGPAPAGVRPLFWDGADVRGRRVPAGLYLVRAESAGSIATGRVVQIR